MAESAQRRRRAVVAASLIPERTIDAWISIVVAGLDPTARIWAPTPRAQAGSEPWDHAVAGNGTKGKLVVLESKALKDDSALVARNPHVDIDLRQLMRLVYLEQKAKLPAYYALPSLTTGDLSKTPMDNPLHWAATRSSPRYVGEWIRVPSASELATHPKVWASIQKGRKWRRLPSTEVGSQPWPDLVEFLAKARRCEVGRLVSDTHPFDPIDPMLLTDQGQQRAVEIATAGVVASGGSHGALVEASAEWSAIHDVPRDESRRSTPLDRTIWIVLSSLVS
jgi:hypothetical protein